MKYNIYSGLRPPKFRGAEPIGTHDFDSIDDAIEFARKHAIELYNKYEAEGDSRIKSLSDIEAEYRKAVGVSSDTPLAPNSMDEIYDWYYQERYKMLDCYVLAQKDDPRFNHYDF